MAESSERLTPGGVDVRYTGPGNEVGSVKYGRDELLELLERLPIIEARLTRVGGSWVTNHIYGGELSSDSDAAGEVRLTFDLTEAIDVNSTSRVAVYHDYFASAGAPAITQAEAMSQAAGGVNGKQIVVDIDLDEHDGSDYTPIDNDEINIQLTTP